MEEQVITPTCVVQQELTIVYEALVNDKVYAFTVPYGCSFTDMVLAFNELGKTIQEQAKKAAEQAAKLQSESESKGAE